MRLLSIICLLLIAPLSAVSQVSINMDGTLPDPRALLDVQSDTMGVLVPRMGTFDRFSMPFPIPNSLLVFDTDINRYMYYYAPFQSWVELAIKEDIQRIQDQDWDTSVDVELWPDEDVIRFHVNGQNAMSLFHTPFGSAALSLGDYARNVFVGDSAGLNNQAVLGLQGDRNTFVGFETGKFNTTGRFNTYLGGQSGTNNATGSHNTGLGAGALFFSLGERNTAVGSGSMNLNTSGADNTAVGASTLFFNQTGDQNTAIGKDALFNNTSGIGGVGVGFEALYANQTGYYNTALGAFALQNNLAGNNTALGYEASKLNTSGMSNVAVGYQASREGSTASFNTAIGRLALRSNQSGNDNVAVGSGALRSNTVGSDLVAVGDSALYFQSTDPSGFYGNTAVGAHAMRENTEGNKNTSLGFEALLENVNGHFNTAVGYQALRDNVFTWNNTAVGESALLKNTGDANTAVGKAALVNNTSGETNVAVGHTALHQNTTGQRNVGIGNAALYLNSEGFHLVAIGYEALYSQAIDTNNFYRSTAVGAFALRNNTTGYHNTALGSSAAFSNTTGAGNVAMGNSALGSNTVGSNNTAVGWGAMTWGCDIDECTAVGSKALFYNHSAGNTAVGYEALWQDSSGYFNTAIGVEALSNVVVGHWNTAVGHSSGTIGDSLVRCTFVGYNANNTGVDRINSSSFGFQAFVDDNNMVRIGDNAVTRIEGQVGWSSTSDARVKDQIREDVPGLDLINRLRPVTFQFNKEKLDRRYYRHDPELLEEATRQPDHVSGTRYTGFIAQEVESIAQELDYNFSAVLKPGDPEGLYSLRYSEFVVPLVKAVQEQQSVIESQRVMISELAARLSQLENQLLSMASEEK